MAAIRNRRRHLGLHLATARRGRPGAELLNDQLAIPGPPVSDSEVQDALDPVLLLADCDALRGDYKLGLSALAAGRGTARRTPNQVRGGSENGALPLREQLVVQVDQRLHVVHVGLSVG